MTYVYVIYILTKDMCPYLRDEHVICRYNGHIKIRVTYALDSRAILQNYIEINRVEYLYSYLYV